MGKFFSTELQVGTVSTLVSMSESGVQLDSDLVSWEDITVPLVQTTLNVPGSAINRSNGIPLKAYSVGALNYSPVFYNAAPAVALNGDEYYFCFHKMKTGTYQFAIRCSCSTDCAIVDIYLDNVLIGTIDQYSGTNVLGRFFFNFDINTEGDHKIRLVSDGKNASSSGYFFNVGDISIEKIEVGWSHRFWHGAGIGITADIFGNSYTVVTVGNAMAYDAHGGPYDSSGFQNAAANGDEFEFERAVYLPAGTYDMIITGHAHTDKGILGIYSNGLQIDTWDMYDAAGPKYNETNTTTITLLVPTSVQLSFKCEGKNASASDYFLGISSFRITRTA